MRPEVRTDGAHWVADLRAAGFGRHRVGEAGLEREEAMHRAYALLARLRGDRMAEVAQRDLFADAGPDLFATTLDRWQADKRTDTDGGAAWTRQHAGLVRRELGARYLRDFAPPDGNARMVAYVRDLEAAGLSGRTIRNRVCILEQVLRFAVERGWLPAAPLHPRMPPKAAPVFTYITEAMFRPLRERIYTRNGAIELRGFRPAEPAEIFVARRRVYLSLLFYTGVHHVDADRANADHLSLDVGLYQRHNTKSARCVSPEWFEMPEQLALDLRELQTVLGRPFFPGEAFAGGPWLNVNVICNRACTALGFPHGAPPAIMRRSYAREMFLRGYEVHEVADRMGHVDEKMLRSIYVRMPRAAGRARTRWTAEPATPPTGGGLARVLKLHKAGA